MNNEKLWSKKTKPFLHKQTLTVWSKNSTDQSTSCQNTFPTTTTTTTSNIQQQTQLNMPASNNDVILTSSSSKVSL